MISCIIRGDLGYQLFQVYATIAYAMKYNQPFMLHYNSDSEYTFYWKNIFQYIKHNVHDLSADGEDNSTVYSDIYSIYWRTQNIANSTSSTESAPVKIEGKNVAPIIVQENPDRYSALIVPIDIHAKNILLDGYFQDSRYFEDEFIKITNLLKIYELQVLIYKKYKTLIFNSGAGIHPIHKTTAGSDNTNTNLTIDTSMEEDIYIGIYLQAGVDFTYYENELRIIMGCSTKNICLLLFYSKEDNTSLQNTINNITSYYSKYKIINTNSIMKIIYMEIWEKMLLLSVCNKIIVASGAVGWWANEYHKYYNQHYAYPIKN
jgi:hypothetical protein